MSTNTQPKALQVAAVLRERLGADCFPADLLESQHDQISEMTMLLALEQAESRDLRARLAEKEAELEAVGAGGVGPLRKRDDSMVRKADVIARLEQGFGAGSAVVMTIKHFFANELPARDCLHQIAEPSRECLKQSAVAEVLLRVIQRLNQNPYSLTKSECISEVSAMRDAARAAQGGAA